MAGMFFRSALVVGLLQRDSGPCVALWLAESIRVSDEIPDLAVVELFGGFGAFSMPSRQHRCLQLCGLSSTQLAQVWVHTLSCLCIYDYKPTSRSRVAPDSMVSWFAS